MYLLPNEEQAEIIDVINAFLADKMSVRRYQDTDTLATSYSHEQWQQFVELGWFGIGVDEQFGGTGLGLADEVLLGREAGRQLISPSIMATSFAIHFAAQQNNSELAQTLSSGEKRVAIALPTGISVDNGKINGQLSIFDGANADYIIACTQTTCFLVDASILAQRTTHSCTDATLLLESVALDKVEATLSSNELSLHNLFGLFIAAQFSGIAEATRDDAAAYAKERTQFDRPIGSFQAINHLCADMAVSADAAWSQTVYTALRLAPNDISDKTTGTATTQEVAAALVVSERAALKNSRDNIQIHGGVGFTVEYNAQFYLKRTHVYRQLSHAAMLTKDVLAPAA